MSLAIKSIECNGGCEYCYEANIRKENKYHPAYIDKIMETLKQLIPNFKQVTIHGGEPLMLGKKNVERLLCYIFAKKGQTGIQTNGILIDDDYLEMFKKYNTHVGFSIDGYTGDSNSLRWQGVDKMVINSNITLNKLADCSKENIRTSVISMVHKKSVDTMVEFVKQLFKVYSITSIRVNPCVFYGKDKSNQIDNSELFELYKSLSDLIQSTDKIKYDDDFKYLAILEHLYSDTGIKKKILESYLPTLNKEIEYTLHELHFPYSLSFNADIYL